MNLGPLDGLVVLDLSRILAGPFASQFLGDLGADVIKVEKPGTGDDTRSWGPPYLGGQAGKETGQSSYYLCANRNKRSLAIDLTDPDGADAIRQLARAADVVLENFKPGGLKKYGLDYAALSAVNPRLIYCSISGYGQTGPNRDLPGYDLMAQGYAGTMAITGDPEGTPMKVGVGVADIMCGMYASNAILAALHHRDVTGDGQHIDIALVDSTISWLANAGTNYLVGGRQERLGNQHPNIVPYQVFAVADGHAIVACGNDGQFRRLCAVLGRPELADDPRYATNPSRLENRTALIALMDDLLSCWTRDDLLAQMKSAGIPGGPINSVAEVFDTDQVAARGMKVAMDHPGGPDGKVELIGNPVKFSKTPVSYRRPPPGLGQHSAEILDNLAGGGAETKRKAG